MFPLDSIQSALQQHELDGWLLYDFRGSNQLACTVLQVPEGAIRSRRCAYFIPAEGDPVKLVHAIEADGLDHLPGNKRVYLSWQQWEGHLEDLMTPVATLAMEYSPRQANPYISQVDAGLIELIQSFKVNIVSSGDLVQQFEATLSEEQWRQHQEAAKICEAAFEVAWNFIAKEVQAKGETDERAVEQVICDHFHKHNLIYHHPPIVGVGENAGSPHYETGTGEVTRIKAGDLLLIDLWAKVDHPHAHYADLTKMCYLGGDVPPKYAKVFQVVCEARDAALNLTREAFAHERELRGYELDDAARDVVEEAGYGGHFTHRLGHSMGTESTHGNGTHLDNLETHDERLMLPATLFTIEPGIYLPEVGVRTEVDVFISAEREVIVTGGEPQTEIRKIDV